MGKLFSGSKQPNREESYNTNKDIINKALSGAMGNTSGASDLVAGLLGIGGDSEASAKAFGNFRDSAGYNFVKDEGLRAVNANQAAKGMFGSGATGRGYAKFSNNLASTYLNDFIKNTLGLGALGNQSAGVIANAGQYAKKNSSKGKKGIGDIAVDAAGAIAASDIRLKENIEEVGRLSKNVGIYEYNYIHDKNTRYRGVMAQEALIDFPEAKGPRIAGGYATVDYSKLPINLERVN